MNLGASSGLSVEQTLAKLLDINVSARNSKAKHGCTGLVLTGQQQQAVDLALEGHNVQVVACAGSGKTTILKRICCGMPQKRGLYLAFNRKNAEAAARKFPPDSVDCVTPHGLAYKAVGYKYAKRLNEENLKASILREQSISR